MSCPLCRSDNREIFSHGKDERKYLKCGICSLVWLDQSQRLALAEERARYSLHQNVDSRYLEYLGRTALPLANRLHSGAVGLDFGCGPSEGGKAVLEPKGFTVDSYDPIFFPRDLLNNHYDFLLCSEAAEHFFFPDREFARMNAVLKSQAWLAFSSQLLSSQIDFDSWYYRRDPTHVVFYSAPTVEWIASRWGWQVIELRSPFWLLRKG